MGKSINIIIALAVIIVGLSAISFLRPPEKVRDSDAAPVLTATPEPSPTVNLTVSHPEINQEIGYIVTIEGLARVFENQFSWRVKDFNGKVLARGNASSDAKEAGEFGKYHITSAYAVPSTHTGFVEVFEYSAKDGSEINKAIVPIRFPQGEVTSFKLFFANPEKGGSECAEKLYSVNRRVPKTDQPLKVALEQLVSGPTTAESREGFISISTSGKIKDVSIADGVAVINFTSEIDDGVAGSCGVSHITRPIAETVTQFPEVKEVKILVDGSEEGLQP